MATDERDTAPKTGNDQALDADSLAGSAEHGGPTMFARIGMLSAEIDASSGSLTHRTKTRIGAAIVEARRTIFTVFCDQLFVKSPRRLAPKSKFHFNGPGGLRTHISSIRIRSFPWHRATGHETIMSG